MAFPVNRVAGGHVGDHVAGWWSTGGGGRELGRSAAGRDPAGQLHFPKGRQQQGSPVRCNHRHDLPSACAVKPSW